MATDYMRDKLHRNQMILPWGESETISTGDTAAMLQCSVETVRSLLEEGRIKGYRITPHKPKSTWRVSRTSVEAYAARVLRNYDLSATPPQSANPAASTASAAPKGPARQ